MLLHFASPKGVVMHDCADGWLAGRETIARRRRGETRKTITPVETPKIRVNAVSASGRPSDSRCNSGPSCVLQRRQPTMPG